MPIRRDLRHWYCTPIWKEKRVELLERAHDCCEECGKPNGAQIFTYTWKSRDLRFGSGWRHRMVWMQPGSQPFHVWRDERGQLVPLESWPCSGLPRRITVRIGVAHLDNDPSNMDNSNLRAWCQWHHLHFDQAFHRATRCSWKDPKRPALAAGEPS